MSGLRKYSPIATSALAMLFLPARVVADPNDAWSWPDAGVANAGTGVWDLLVWDGEGSQYLYVGGDIIFAGGSPVNGIARWDGDKWSNIPGGGLPGGVMRLFAFDALNGPALYVGGSFNSAGGKPAQNIARYQNGSWSTLGGGLSASPWALVQFDDGSGPALYVGGVFWHAGGKQVNFIARWDGQEWYPLGLGLSDSVFALAVHDDGAGPALYAGGQFYGANAKLVNRIAKWDGRTWSDLAGGVTGLQGAGAVTALQAFDDGSGPKLFVSGSFNKAGQVSANGLATWDGKNWAAADAGFPPQEPAYLKEFAVYDAGAGPVLYALGGNVVRRWNGESWEALNMSGVFFGPVLALAGFKDASGARLHIGGQLFVDGKWKNIARQTDTIGGGTPCGDLTGDGFVNQQDLGILLGDWGCTKGVGLCPGDCDNDGDTDQADLGILLSNWEKPCP